MQVREHSNMIFLSNVTFLMLDSTWSETKERFQDKESAIREESVVCDLIFIITEGVLS